MEYLGSDTGELGKVSGEIINEEVIDTLSMITRQNRNFFIWIHYLEPHFPFLPPSNYLPNGMSRKKAALLNAMRYVARLVPPNEKIHKSLSDEDLRGIKNLYKGELKSVENHICNLIKNLRSLGILDNTGIFITSDHGEAFYEHKRFHHEFHLYDELIHVPLWIFWSDIDIDDDRLVSLVDLAPTILGFLGIKKPVNWIGKNILDPDFAREIIVSEATEDEATREVFLGRMNLSKRKIAIRSKYWKYIYNESGQDELYNLEEDPEETVNLVTSEPKIVCEMKKRLDTIST